VTTANIQRGVLILIVALANAACGEVTIHLLDGPGQDGGGSDGPTTRSYRATILADAPLAYWRFGEQSGTIAHDETGNGNTASIGTGVTWNAAGALLNDTNTAVHLSGTQGLELQVASQFDFPGNDRYSLEGWVYADTAFDGNFRHLFFKDDVTQPSTGREEYGVYMQATDGLVFERYVMGTATKVYAPLPALKEWAYVVATYDGARLALYVNGQNVATALDIRSQASKTDPEFLGCKTFDNVSVDGALDEFAIYDYPLSSAQVTAHWKASGR
jgi:Concanavalin A-like lectin/glucanases superfamily